VPGADVALIVRPAANQSGSKPQVLLKDRTDKDGRFRLVKHGVAGRDFYQMHVLAAARGHGLGWADLRPDRPPFSAKGKAMMGKAEPKPPGAQNGQTIIRLAPEQVLKGRLVDLLGFPAANVKFRVASVRMVTAEKPAWDMIVPGGFLRLPGGPGDPLEFAEALSPKDWPYLPPTLTTDKEGRFTLPGFGPGVEVVLLVQDDRFALQDVPLRIEEGQAKEVSSSLVPPESSRGRSFSRTPKSRRPAPGWSSPPTA
jgi:hypothetical protein